MLRWFDRRHCRYAQASAAQQRWFGLELATLVISLAIALVELGGGPTSGAYPLVYAALMVLLLDALDDPPRWLYFALLASGSSAMLHQPTGPAQLWAMQTGFIWLFLLGGGLLLRRLGLSVEASVNFFSASEARDFRLGRRAGPTDRRTNDMAAAATAGDERGSVRAIHESLYSVLAVAEQALTPYTVALFWLDSGQHHLVLKELRSQSDDVVEEPFRSGVGLLGAALKKRETILLNELRPGHPGLVYYRKDNAIRHFAAAPLIEDDKVRGVLVADRSGPQAQPFTAVDQQTLETIAVEAVRAVQVERVFHAMTRDKFRRERFYKASRAFNRALTVQDVCGVALDTVEEICGPPFAAVVVVDSEDPSQLVVQAVRGAKASSLAGHRFAAEGTLSGATLKAKHSLPLRTEHAANQPLFAGVDLRLSQVKLVPLLWQDRGTGVLVLGSEVPDFVGPDLLEMVEVIADHAAIAIENALMYERMERMATTDGLTLLANHRHFQELFDGQLARAERYQRQLSLILVDIDHFKFVNDTYGHPVGDAVLKQVAKLLADNARVTDVAARYGGEEFAMILDETDKEGAIIIAERIRQGMMALEFHSSKGNFGRTMCLGVATFPDDGKHKTQLIERADKALYQAKEGGRNRVVAHDRA